MQSWWRTSYPILSALHTVGLADLLVYGIINAPIQTCASSSSTVKKTLWMSSSRTRERHVQFQNEPRWRSPVLARTTAELCLIVFLFRPLRTSLLLLATCSLGSDWFRWNPPEQNRTAAQETATTCEVCCSFNKTILQEDVFKWNSELSFTSRQYCALDFAICCHYLASIHVFCDIVQILC